MKTIRAKIILGILLCSLLTAGIVGVLAITSTMKITEKDAVESMSYYNVSVANELNATIDGIGQSIDTLSDLVLSNLDEKKFMADKSYADAYTSHILGQVHTFAENTEGAITCYVRYNPEYSNPTSGCFLTRDSLSDPFTEVEPTDFSMYEEDDAEHVGWYYIPVKNGAPLWMDPYENSNINVYMISYVVPLFTEDGTSIGIVGMDIEFSMLTDAVDSINMFEHGYGILTKPDGEILYQKDNETGKNISELDSSLADYANFVSNADNEKQALTYRYNKVEKKLVFCTLQNNMILAFAAPASEINAQSYTLFYYILGAVLIALVVCIVVGFFVGNGLSRPINDLTDIIEHTAQLDLTSSKNGEKLCAQKDEIGHMANEVRHMRGSFRDMVDSFNEVERTVNASIDNLDNIMRDNNSRADDNNSATQQLAAGMQEATASTEQIVHNVAQAKAQSDDIYRMASDGEKDSIEIQNRAKEMERQSGESSEKTHRMYETMKEKSELAIERSKAVGRINEFTDAIKSVSSQTNLLALNASIEAARAGEAGKGFAVVATEIGALADETLQTVDNIDGIVNEVNDAVSSMNDCIQELMGFLEQTVLGDYTMFLDSGERYKQDADFFIRVMTDVRNGVDMLEKNIEEIEIAANEINNMTGNSSDGINEIADKSVQMREANEEGYNKLSEARESVGELMKIVDKFTWR